MMPRRVPTISGTGVSSRIRVPGEMYGLKLAASGLSGLYPTMSGISLGGFLRSISGIGDNLLPVPRRRKGRAAANADQPKVERRSGRLRTRQADDPAIEHEPDDGKGHSADDNGRRGK